jgi:hypothetical protein
MGRVDQWSETLRLGQLPKEERKAISKVVTVKGGGTFEHASVCTAEIGAMLVCFEEHEWDTTTCMKEIHAMHGCVDLHKNDPVRAAAARATGGPRRSGPPTPGRPPRSRTAPLPPPTPAPLARRTPRCS